MISARLADQVQRHPRRDDAEHGRLRRVIRRDVQQRGAAVAVVNPGGAPLLEPAHVGDGPAVGRGMRGFHIRGRGAEDVPAQTARVRRGHDHEVGGACRQGARARAGVGVESRRVRIGAAQRDQRRPLFLIGGQHG